VLHLQADEIVGFGRFLITSLLIYWPIGKGTGGGIEMRRAVLPLLGLLPLISGCGTGATDTGYEPRRLGMTDSQRKALYAPRYSPEQAQAQAEHDTESHRRPAGGSMGLNPSY
jgi:hypothetical protein